MPEPLQHLSDKLYIIHAQIVFLYTTNWLLKSGCISLGSSVATSLAAGESLEKKVGILEIYKDKFKITPVPLQTVRPFVFQDVVLERPDSENFAMDDPSNQALDYIKARVRTVISRLKAEREGKNVLLFCTAKSAVKSFPSLNSSLKRRL